MWRIGLVVVVMVAVVMFGFSLVNVSGGTQVETSTLLEAPPLDVAGFARAVAPYDWQFPQDFGAHPDFQTEWWYYTGNLTADTGEEFGFQFTLFRRAITPTATTTGSEWRDNQLYLVHFTVSDLDAGKFYHDERYSRGGDGLAGAVAEPVYHVWLENWQVQATDSTVAVVNIRADASDFAVDLALTQVKPPALQGDQGLSPKSAETGNASYYYSLTRLPTSGTIRVGDRSYTVSGVSWKDHEFSTSALGSTAQGWDWFGLIFDDDSELMLGKIRLQDGGQEPAFGGLYVYPDGTTLTLPSDAFTITPTNTWTSPHTGAVYPSGWQVVIEHPQLQLSLTVAPAAQDQELTGAAVEYWEGAVRIQGDKTGVGYAELTGYVNTMQGRF